MKGWGSVSLLVALGVFMAAGCGGRTDTLYDDGEPNQQAGTGATGNTGTGGTRNTAGRPGRAGASSKGGGGPVPSGGASYAGAYPIGGAYAGSFPAGGYAGAISFGGYAGAFPMGGFGGTAPVECQSCIFQICGEAFAQCFQDFGCLSILGCAQATGCQAFECYSPQTCAPVIDQWGGLAGPSMGALLGAFSCAIQSGCPCN